MYVPAPPAQPALAWAPFRSVSTGLPLTAAPFVGLASTTLHIGEATLNVLAGDRATVTGTLSSVASGSATWVGGAAAGARSSGVSGEIVSLQVAGRRGWSTIARARTGKKGRFELRYVPRRTGSERVRVGFDGDASVRGSHRRLGELNVFRAVEASWYGGGGGLACGGTLTSTTMGVANKTLPCGTLVTLRYDGRSIRVPVIDRGPYVAGREFDLTEAAKQALGFDGVGELWSTS
jgi:rare lipoprotein A